MTYPVSRRRSARVAVGNRRGVAVPAPVANDPPVSTKTLLALTGAGLIGAVAGGALARPGSGERPGRPARLAGYGAALLAASVLADSAMEHYRGSYAKSAMYAAPVASALAMIAGVATAGTRAGRWLKTGAFSAAAASGLIGLGFHVRNILSRPGGYRMNNLFYRAPFGAPAALALAGAAGLGAVGADRTASGPQARRSGRLIAMLTALGLYGLTAEVGLLHFRGAFQDKAMYLPVVAVPLAGSAMAVAAARPSASARRIAAGGLKTTAALGAVGVGFHAYGVSRNMGGFRNWQQNLLQGPPIAAPPSLAGLALVGLSALDLLKDTDKGKSDD